MLQLFKLSTQVLKIENELVLEVKIIWIMKVWIVEVSLYFQFFWFPSQTTLLYLSRQDKYIQWKKYKKTEKRKNFKIGFYKVVNSEKSVVRKLPIWKINLIRKFWNGIWDFKTREISLEVPNRFSGNWCLGNRILDFGRIPYLPLFVRKNWNFEKKYSKVS